MNPSFPVKYKDLDFIITIESYDYFPAEAPTGPSYSSGGTPGTDEDIDIIDGYVEFDGNVEDIQNITSAEIDLIMQLTNDNLALFDAIVEDQGMLLGEKLLEYEYEVQQDMASERAAYYYNQRYDERV